MRHLAALCLSLLLPVLLLAGTLAWSYTMSERDQLDEAVLAAARETRVVIDRDLSGLVATVQVLSLSPFLQSGDLDAFDAQARTVQQQLGVHVVLSDRESRQLVNTRLPRGAQLPVNLDPETDRTVLMTSRPVTSDLVISAVTRKPLFMISAPVRVGSEVRYLLSLSLSPDRVRDLLSTLQLPPAWTTSVVDRRGDIIAHSGQHEALVGRALPRRLWEHINTGGNIAHGELLGPAEEPVHAAHSRLRQSGWTAVVTVPAILANAPLRHALLVLGLLTPIFIAAAAGLAVLFARRIARPMLALATEAGKVGRGQAPEPLATGLREVDEVSMALSRAGAERGLAELALRDSEARLRLFIEHAPAAIAVFDPEMRYLAVSRRYITDYRLDAASGPAALLGRSHYDVFPEMPKAWRDIHRRVLAGETLAAEEDLFLRADGREDWVRWELTPWHRADGTVGGILLFSEVVTARKEAEAALREGEARLFSILETVPDAMVVIDERGVIETFSRTAERLFGWSAEEVIGRNVSMLMPNPDRERHDGYLARYLATGERRIIGTGRVTNAERRDGSLFPMELAVGEVCIGGRRLFTGFIRDLTERQQSQRRMQELQAELLHVSRLSAAGEMGSALAHELNQPLTAIASSARSALRMLQATAASGQVPARVLEAMERAAQQSLRAGQIVRRLREFVSKGEADTRLENLPKLIEEAGALALVGTRDSGVHVTFQFAAPLPSVLVDRIQIQQVLLNLIRNAVEAMTGDGTPDGASPQRELVVTAAARGPDMVEVAVSDTGPGLAPEVLEHLFETFVTTKPGGMGVGLSICRTIIEAHAGRIWAEANPGGGTVFRFTLPAAPPEAEAGLHEG